MNRSARRPFVPPPDLEAFVYRPESATAAFDAGVTDASVPESAPPPAPPPRIDSGRLFGGCRELVIEHAGCEYRLRRTRTGKLILTK